MVNRGQLCGRAHLTVERGQLPVACELFEAAGTRLIDDLLARAPGDATRKRILVWAITPEEPAPS